MTIVKSEDGPSELFSKAFDRSVVDLEKHEKLDNELKECRFPPQRKRLLRKKQKIDSSFSKLNRYSELTPHINQYLAQNDGRIDNIADLISFLRQRCKSLQMVGDPAIRLRLKLAYGICGKPGRKKKS